MLELWQRLPGKVLAELISPVSEADISYRNPPPNNNLAGSAACPLQLVFIVHADFIMKSCISKGTACSPGLGKGAPCSEKMTAG